METHALFVFWLIIGFFPRPRLAELPAGRRELLRDPGPGGGRGRIQRRIHGLPQAEGSQVRTLSTTREKRDKSLWNV